MFNNKSLYQIALTCISGVGVMHARNLVQAVGDEEMVFKEKARVLEKIPRIPHRLINEIHNPEVMKRAEKELQFIEKNNIRLHFFTSPDYPQRLTNCIDAPIVLYSKGNIDFNRIKVVSIIGTRNATDYGQRACRDFIQKLGERFPHIIIVSGLAYGIDICAHRAALQNNLSTIAVLAHGLDRIYPHMHRGTAVEMLKNGALITEFTSETNPDKHNFVRRNRIVAGMADAVVVVESGEKGGSLITADVANSYFREVFALPGRVTDKMSIGCNKLIFDSKAVLLRDPDDFIAHMGWETHKKTAQPKQKELFLNLTEEEEKIFNALNENEGNNGKQVNTLAIELNMPVSELFFTLLELEMKNIVQALPGGVYKLL